MLNSDELKAIREEIAHAATLPDYNAFEQLYVCMVKLAAEYSDANEFRRIKSLVESIPQGLVSSILAQPATMGLLNLDPPLETLLVNRHEELATENIQTALDELRTSSSFGIYRKIKSLCYVLKSIRNKREHGFKSKTGPRDQEILQFSTQILRQIIESLPQISRAI